MPADIFEERLWKKKRFRKTPWCIYFYYIGKRTNGTKFVRHYYYTNENEELDPEDLPDRIKTLALNARLEDERDQKPPPTGSDLHFVVWTRKSYLVFMIDIEGLNFDPNDPVSITSVSGNPNRSFYDGKMVTITLPTHATGTAAPSVFRCINHMKKGNGADQDGKERFKITLNTIPQLSIVSHDDGGTNMGPPVPPP